MPKSTEIITVRGQNVNFPLHSWITKKPYVLIKIMKQSIEFNHFYLTCGVLMPYPFVCRGLCAVQWVVSVSNITTPRCGWIELKFSAYIYKYLNLCLLGFGDVPHNGYVIKAP